MKTAIICASLAFIINLILSVILLYKSNEKRERLIFGIFTLSYVLNTLYYILNGGNLNLSSIIPFSFTLLLNGAFVIVLFLIFPLEALLPRHLQRRWFIALFLIPVALFNIIWNMLCHSGMEVFHLTNTNMILSELNNASVILRLVFFCFIILFFLGSIIFMIWAHKQYMTDRVLRIYAYATIPIMIIFVFIIIHGLTDLLYTSHMIYIIFFNSYISYAIIQSDKTESKEIKTVNTKEEDTQNISEDNDIKKYDAELLFQLDYLMNVEKVYCSPDLSLPELARMLGTNRTKLSEIIRMKGFTNFSTYLNSYRLKEFLRIIDSNEAEKISNASFLAGFGSKASLHRCFTSAYGVSPSKYLKR